MPNLNISAQACPQFNNLKTIGYDIALSMRPNLKNLLGKAEGIFSSDSGAHPLDSQKAFQDDL